MECKLKAFLTSWIPWKLINKYENLFYFPNHLSLFCMYWLLLCLVPGRHNRIGSCLAEKTSCWTEKVAVEVTILAPLQALVELQLSSCAGAFGKCSPVGVRCAAFPPHPLQHLLLRPCHSSMHRALTHTAFLGLPHFVLHRKVSPDILLPKLIAQMCVWHKQDISYLLFVHLWWGWWKGIYLLGCKAYMQLHWLS